jgi:hypothetical protein
MGSDHRRWGPITEDGVRSEVAELGYIDKNRQLFGIVVNYSE